MKTENEEEEYENIEKIGNDNENEIQETNNLKLIIEKENEYKAQIEQLSSELEIEKKVNQSIKRKPEEEELITRLKNKLTQKRIRYNTLKITNEKQNQAINELSQRLSNTYKKSTHRKNVSDFSKNKEEPVNIILKIKEKDINQALLELNNLKKENYIMIDDLERTGEYNKQVELEDISKENQEKINSLNYEIQMLDKELKDHKICIQEYEDFEKAKNKLKEQIKIVKDNNRKLNEELLLYEEKLQTLTFGEKKVKENKNKKNENNENIEKVDLNYENEKYENNDNNKEENNNFDYQEDEEKEKQLLKTNIKPKTKRLINTFDNKKNIKNNSLLYTSKSVVDVRKEKKKISKEKKSLKLIIANTIVTNEFKKKLEEIMASKEDANELIKKIKNIENKRIKIENKNKIDLINQNQEINNLNEQFEMIEMKKKQLEINNRILKLSLNEYIKKQKKSQKTIINYQNQLDFLSQKSKEKEQEIKILTTQVNTLRKMISYGTVENVNDNKINEYIKKIQGEEENLKNNIKNKKINEYEVYDDEILKKQNTDNHIFQNKYDENTNNNNINDNNVEINSNELNNYINNNENNI